MRVSLIILFISIEVFSQNDNVYWTKAEYNLQSNRDTSALIQKESSFLSPILFGYRLFISDLDGDNCPFYPSCSHFLSQAVHKTNIFQGSLMFFDRFTRDMNFINRSSRYKTIKNKRYYDPPSLYTLKRE